MKLDNIMTEGLYPNASGLSHVTEAYSIDNSSSAPGDGVPMHPITHVIEIYLIPIICVFGLTGNTLATVIFLTESLRNNSCSVFLAARGLSDNGFLSTLLVIWLSRIFQLQLGTVDGSCRIIIFLSYVCGCISVWLVVFVTAENYIRICRPFIVNSVCTPNIARVCVAILCCLAIGLYCFPFWTMSPKCSTFPAFYDTVQAMVYTDTVITLVIPLLCIICAMTAIVCCLIKAYKRRNKLRAPTARRVNPMAKITKMLFAVTISFFCLILPSHVNRLRLMITALLDPSAQSEYSLLDEAVQQITLLIYNISLSMNIVVYIVFGSRFRKVCVRLFCSSCTFRNTFYGFFSKNNNFKPEGRMKPVAVKLRKDGQISCGTVEAAQLLDS